MIGEHDVQRPNWRNMEVYADDMLVKSAKFEDHIADLKETFKTLRSYGMKINPAKCAFEVSLGKFLGFMVFQQGIETNPEKVSAVLEMQPPKDIKQLQCLTGPVAALDRFISQSTDKCLPVFKIQRKTLEWNNKCEEAFQQLKQYLTTLNYSAEQMKENHSSCTWQFPLQL
jgi:hypothetical protein